jgi:putative ABC transport system permease protein
MLFPEILRVALASLRANKLRSMLTMLGIVIGVAAVIAMAALGTGAQKQVEDRIASLGTTLLQVNATRMSLNGVRLEDPQRLTMDDVELLRERGKHLVEIQPQQDSRFQVTYLNQNTNTRVVGTTPNFLMVRKFELAAGRMFNEREDEGMRRVAVVGSQVATDLGFDDPSTMIGQNLRIRGAQFEVVGVLKEKGQATPWGNDNDQIVVPQRTGRYRLFGHDRLNDIYVLARNESEIPIAMEEITSALRRSHRLMPGEPDDFRIRNQADFLTTMGETTQVFTYLLSGIAAVSLLVGGIGIMNIMLVSVTERTREIGIRKALGATRKTILLQFLTEAVALCLAGGAIGAALGVGTAQFLRTAFDWNTMVGPWSIGMAFAFSATVGVVFGVWPARRAASLDPIVALRYE